MLSPGGATLTDLAELLARKINDLPTDGGLLLICGAFLVIFWKALTNAVQRFLEVWLKRTGNIYFALLFLLPLIVFFVIDYLLAFLLAIIPLVIFGWLHFFSTFKVIRRSVVILQLVFIASLFFGEQLYEYHVWRENKSLEVYLLFPRESTVDLDDKRKREIKRNLFETFSAVFADTFDTTYIKICPESYGEFAQELEIALPTDTRLAEKVFEYGKEKGMPVDIVVRKEYSFYEDETSQYVIVIYFAILDEKNKRLHKQPQFSIRGTEDNLQFLSIQACYNFMNFIKNRKIIKDGREVLIANDKNLILKRLLERFLVFLETRREVDLSLVEEIKKTLRKASPLAEDQVEAFLELYQPRFDRSEIEDRFEKQRKANIRKLGIRK